MSTTATRHYCRFPGILLQFTLLYHLVNEVNGYKVVTRKIGALHCTGIGPQTPYTG